MNTTTTKGTEVVVIGHGYWGKGPDLVTAKKHFRQYGGSLSDGYVIVTFPPTITFTGVNDFGQYGWVTADGSDYDRDNPAHQPTVEEIKPRQRRR